MRTQVIKTLRFTAARTIVLKIRFVILIITWNGQKCIRHLRYVDEIFREAIINAVLYNKWAEGKFWQK